MKNQLNALAAALSIGILWGLCLFVWTFVAMKFAYGISMLEMISEVYPWYEVTTAGAFIGLLWGFLDGFIGTFALISVYNFFVRKLK